MIIILLLSVLLCGCGTPTVQLEQESLEVPEYGEVFDGPAEYDIPEASAVSIAGTEGIIYSDSKFDVDIVDDRYGYYTIEIRGKSLSTVKDFSITFESEDGDTVGYDIPVFDFYYTAVITIEAEGPIVVNSIFYEDWDALSSGLVTIGYRAEGDWGDCLVELDSGELTVEAESDAWVMWVGSTQRVLAVVQDEFSGYVDGVKWYSIIQEVQDGD